MKKFIISVLAMLMSVTIFANENFSMLYEVQKGAKKLGYYQTTFLKDGVESYSYGAANRLEMFSSKKVIFTKDGLKNVDFSKNKKSYKFIVATKLSALDAGLKKKYDRKFKKVQNDAMLFITKDTKKRIELFNKRKTTIKTLDELLRDIYMANVTYEKFILFDKLGVMKMVASVSTSANAITITNASKHKAYMKITLDKNIPVKIESLLSTWSATLQKSGIPKEYKVDLNEMVAKSYKAGLKKELQRARVEISKAKKSKKSYNFSGSISLALPQKMLGAKSYKQKEHCKKLFKKSKVKFKKLSINEGICKASLKANIKLKTLKKSILELLSEQYPQLKMTKKVKFNKNSITYEVL